MLHDAVGLFQTIRKGPRPRMTPLKRYLKRICHAKSAFTYIQKNPDKNHPYWGRFRNGKTRKQVNYEFFMKNGDEVLAAQGADLDELAEHFDVDQTLPVQEKQEQVYQAMADKYIQGDEKWSLDKIARLKKHFLETLEKTQFINLTCNLLNLKESLVRTWMQTDIAFADSVHSTQVRFGERVAHTMLVKAMNGDLGAQMYVLKQFGDAVNFVDPDIAQKAATTDLQVDKLTPEEQETLLRLMRKAQEGGSYSESTKFIEEEEEQTHPLLGKAIPVSPIPTTEEPSPTEHSNTIDYCGD